VSGDPENPRAWLEGDRFWIGGEDLLASMKTDEDEAETSVALEEVRVRIGTLLKTETVSFLLGAGVSVECGGPLIGRVPPAVERSLQTEGIFGSLQPRVRRWLKAFYLAARHARDAVTVPVSREEILKRQKALKGDTSEALCVNFEQVLALLYRWRSALLEAGGRLRLDASPAVDVTAQELDECLKRATRALAQACVLPTDDTKNGLLTFKTFLRKLLTRPLNLKRVNLFTLNYDTLVEQAADAEGIVLLDGFVGTERRIFRPECYEQDLYFPAETTEGRVHRLDRVVHLYKLHGSITWVGDEPDIDNPYGVTARPFDPSAPAASRLIYPTPAKYGETLGMPYSELFRRFAAALVRPQSVLFTVGYGFGDEHVNAIIREALVMPSFTLVVVDPKPQSEFVTVLRQQGDQRVWIAEGAPGTFKSFVERVLPDLRDEDIRKKVVATYRALSKKAPPNGGVEDVD